MQNTATNVIAICLAVTLLFVVPLVALTERNDNVVQENVELIVEQFVNEVQNTGTITTAKYEGLENSLVATGNTYDIEMEIQHLDENPGKKTTQANYTKIGENVYYSEYTTQILSKLGIGTETSGSNTSANSSKTIKLKEGDRIVVSVKNTNDTQAQILKGSLLSFSNAGQYTISASKTGMITVDGQ